MMGARMNYGKNRQCGRMSNDVNHIIHEKCCVAKEKGGVLIPNFVDDIILSWHIRVNHGHGFVQMTVKKWRFWYFFGARESCQLATKDTDLRMGSDQEDDADDGDDLAKIYDHLDALAAHPPFGGKVHMILPCPLTIPDSFEATRKNYLEDQRMS